ncbi:hypothetical protein DEO72_LG8g2602 [Vigna unguiculata]|uniref:Uncharacterized protein n=1 Tax=Vigna unguiculata TaxID=3917 RepID=A0A4D6MSX1_VIGUN|nr:hypothetical protein DEO72_LG8g2602 [Vigna unguiculata]
MAGGAADGTAQVALAVVEVLAVVVDGEDDRDGWCGSCCRCANKDEEDRSVVARNKLRGGDLQ